MLFTSFSQLVVLLVLFVGGLAFGLALHPGGKKWRQRFKDESANYAQFRRDADKRLDEAKQRIAELERANAALQDSEAAARKQVSDAQVRIAGAEEKRTATVATAAPAAAAVPAAFVPSADTAPGDAADLTRISGIDAALAARLGELGVTRFADIADLSDVDEMALEQRLALPAGYIAREQWREQAAALRDRRDDEQMKRFPPL